MTTDPERSARIIESQVVGDGSDSDEALCALAAEVRTMDPDRIAIADWVRREGRQKQINSDTLLDLAYDIIDDADAD